MQAKLHRWAAADPGRRFDDLFNFVYDPATLMVAYARVAGNRGANTPGVDGMTVAWVEERVGVPGFLDDLRAQLKDGHVRAAAGAGTQDPQAGRVGEAAQARYPRHRGPGRPGRAEAGAGAHLRGGFPAGSYGFRPKRRAHDAIAEIHHFGTQGYRWVLDADIEAAFDNLSHSSRHGPGAGQGQGQARAGAGEGVPQGRGPHRARRAREDTHTGTPQGGILSPLIFNIAMSALDEHLMRRGSPAGRWVTGKRRTAAPQRPADWRLVRYADDCAPRARLEVAM